MNKRADNNYCINIFAYCNVFIRSGLMKNISVDLLYNSLLFCDF